MERMNFNSSSSSISLRSFLSHPYFYHTIISSIYTKILVERSLDDGIMRVCLIDLEGIISCIDPRNDDLHLNVDAWDHIEFRIF